MKPIENPSHQLLRANLKELRVKGMEQQVHEALGDEAHGENDRSHLEEALAHKGPADEPIARILVAVDERGRKQEVSVLPEQLQRLLVVDFWASARRQRECCRPTSCFPPMPCVSFPASARHF
jgi:hypothetical protein